MLAEDGPDKQRLLGVIPRAAGADLQVAVNGRVAVAFASEGKRLGESLDLIVLDIEMPVVDGCEAAWRLRHAGYRRPVIALAAYAMREDRDRCREAAVMTWPQ